MTKKIQNSLISLKLEEIQRNILDKIERTLNYICTQAIETIGFYLKDALLNF